MARQFTLSLTENSEKEEDTFKLTVLGHKGVGKSTFNCRLMKHWIELSRQEKKKWKRSKGCGDLGIKGRSLTVDTVDITVKARFPFMQKLPSCDVYVLVYSLVCDGSFEAVVAARDQIIQQEGPLVPIVFVANKTDIADSVDKTERVYRDLNISCEWENGHVEISAERDTSVLPVLEQIMKRHQKYVSPGEKKRRSKFSKALRSIRNRFSTH
ncbi:GTP-binding protein rhb1-like [Haliotis rubra]|uniref:GTP-binding protein rhb1-like n=1 Tax=Haliotis rubra TaxID=36100 RepID=UPI001EE51535|nr:GTP-binding protein rhb1-like [Haliotis rubra]